MTLFEILNIGIYIHLITLNIESNTLLSCYNTNIRK